MKKVTLVILLSSASMLGSNLQAQVSGNNYNVILALDGKLIVDAKVDFFKDGEWHDDTNGIIANYTIGNLELPKQWVDTLKKDEPIKWRIHTFEGQDDSRKYTFEGKITLGLMEKDFLIISITNLNRKKKKYHITISAPGVYSIRHPKEYDLLKTF